MPGIRDPRFEWLKPENESVFDSYWLKIARKLARLAGAGDPESEVMGLAGAMEVPGPAKQALTDLATVARRGLYSRVDDLAAKVGKKGVSPARLSKLVRADTALAEEAAYRNVPALIERLGGPKVTQKTIPLADLQAHLAEHPAPTPTVVTRGEPPADLIAARKGVEARAKTMRSAAFDDPKDWVGVDQLQRSNAFWWAQEAARGDARALGKLKEIAVDPDHLDTLLAWGRLRNESTAIGDQIAKVPTTKYGLHTVPGGEHYRETVMTLPPERRWLNGEPITAEDLATPAGREAADRVGSYAENVFQSSHFEEPNIVVHTRANERTLPTGERGRFIEEVQSDLHQKAKKEGYGPKMQVTAYYDTPSGQVPLGYGETEAAALADVHPDWPKSVEVKFKTEKVAEGIPDAPFKETWPDLGLKQQVLEAAADPNAQWIGHTGGATQAARYDLSKQISEVHYSGTNLVAYDHAGERVINQTGVTAAQLPQYLGEEGAKRLLAQPKQGTLQTLSGVELQVGGEGMHEFYDKLLPSRLQKILRPFGGTVEKGSLGGQTKAEIDAAMDALHAAPWTNATAAEMNRLQALRNAAPEDTAMWLAKLTPEMKARILKEGLPLSVLLGLIPLSQVGEQLPPPQPKVY